MVIIPVPTSIPNYRENNASGGYCLITITTKYNGDIANMLGQGEGNSNTSLFFTNYYYYLSSMNTKYIYYDINLILKNKIINIQSNNNYVNKFIKILSTNAENTVTLTDNNSNTFTITLTSLNTSLFNTYTSISSKKPLDIEFKPNVSSINIDTVNYAVGNGSINFNGSTYATFKDIIPLSLNRLTISFWFNTTDKNNLFYFSNEDKSNIISFGNSTLNINNKLFNIQNSNEISYSLCDGNWHNFILFWGTSAINNNYYIYIYIDGIKLTYNYNESSIDNFYNSNTDADSGVQLGLGNPNVVGVGVYTTKYIAYDGTTMTKCLINDFRICNYTFTASEINTINNTTINREVSVNEPVMPKSFKTINDILGEISNTNYDSNHSQINPNPERLNKLNDTYRKRYIEYIKIILVIVIALVSVWFCRILESMDYLSSSTSDFTLIKILGITVIFVYVYYQNIQKHNLIIYDQIDYQSPPNVSYGTAGPSKSPSPTSSSQNKKDSCPAQKPVIGNQISSTTYYFN
jgi:hypothetical protein